MLLLANGCSHTAGAEIEYELQGTCYEKAYAKHTAELLGWDYENIANSGASQERIIRTTIDWIGKNYKIYKNKEIFVVIMWSGPSRIEFYDDRKHKYVQVVPNNDVVYKKQFACLQLYAQLLLLPFCQKMYEHKSNEQHDISNEQQYIYLHS